MLGELALGMVIIDDEQRVTWVNELAARLLNTNAQELLGQPVHDLALPYQAPGEDDRAQLQVDGALIGITQRYRHMGGQGALLILFDRSHSLVQFLSAISSGVPGTVAASGVLERGAVMYRLETEVSRSRRYANPLSVITVTVQGADDSAMTEIARRLKGQMRWVDLIGQWHDDVLIIVLPETNAEATYTLAEKLWEVISGVPAANGLLMAVGWAAWQRGESASQMVSRSLAGSHIAAIEKSGVRRL